MMAQQMLVELLILLLQVEDKVVEFNLGDLLMVLVLHL